MLIKVNFLQEFHTLRPYIGFITEKRGTLLKKDSRTIVYDNDLSVEAYRFEGVMQKFPNHFHEHYVIGFIERGVRHLAVGNREYMTAPGDLLLFNPRDPHTCWQVGEDVLDYRCLNIEPDVMSAAAGEITGRKFAPFFREQVVRLGEIVPTLRELHAMILENGNALRKQELFYLFTGELINAFAGESAEREEENAPPEITAICGFIENNYAENITLDELSELSGLDKYNLLRQFAKEKGITPYRYLETIRISKAKALLERGKPPAEAALRTGFSDQSHFTNFFKKFIGLTPKQYGNIFTKNNGGREGKK